MATYSIDSLPDGGLFTRLTIEARTGTLTAVQVYKTGQPPVLVDSLPLATNQFCVFNILFVRYDLKVQTNNSIPLGSVDYSLRQTATAQVSQTQAALSLAYNVPAKRYPRPAPAPPLPAFGGAIPVTVTFRRSDPGWIEVDLKFDYPPDIESDDADTAWELRVFPLRMLLNSESMNSYTALTADGGLTPFGDISQTGPVSIEMPVQFTSLFKFGRNNTTSINHIKGVAFAGTDENGHQKVTHYYRPDAATSAVEFQLTGPIHLKQGKFVRPVTSPGYVMSAGDDLGYGGARMTYRIRAFQIEGTAKNAPVDWHDAAKLYRKWVWTRTATIFRKHNAAHENRQTNAPVDNMSPFTIVCNYSLDGPVAPRDQAGLVPAWLEQHPIVVPPGGPDVPNNPAKSLQQTLIDLRSLFNSPNIRLEAQVWGFEMGGFYRFLGGLPPITNLVNPNNAGPNRFKAAMDQLFNLTIIPIITTDPLRANFDRRRFRGHLALQIDNTWDYQIVAGFPSEIVSKLAAKVTTTTAQTLWDSGNRVFLMKPGYQQADSLRGQAKYRWNGTVDTNKEGLTRFRGLEQYSICPTPVVESLYLDQWLKSNSMDPGGVFDHGSRLLEFMKHGYWQHYCYQKGHSHTGPRAQYDGVIGFGAWYVKRLQKILDGVYSRGLSVYPSFSLTNEFVFTEALVPYFDEFYDHATSSASVFSGDTRSLELLRLEGKPRTRQAVPLFQFIYSEKVTAKMNIIEDDPLSMPGYKEVKKSTAPPVAEPTYMLREAMDDEVPSFSAWQSASRAYFEQTFDRNATQNGLAPLGYATNEGGIYTYNRCVQDVMNLRSRIFRFGAGAVRGERIILPASWIDEPYDYNVPAIEMAKRCAQMQIFFAKYFRLGYMLGQTQIVSGNKSLSALRIRRRNFSDVNELVKVLYTQQEVGGQVKINISDSESRGIDKERIAPLGNYQYQPWEEDQKNTSNPIHTDKIQHMIWQSTKVMAGQTRNLYVFANVGNRDATIEFLYSRGFSGSTPMNRTIRVFNGNPNPAASATRSVKVGDTEAGLFIARRSLVAVEIVP